jgi:hypothetical protein
MKNNIRWNFINKCRYLAKSLYGDDVFVEIPKRIELCGTLNVYETRESGKGNAPVDSFLYEFSVVDDRTKDHIIKITSKNKNDKVVTVICPTTKEASIEFPLVRVGGVKSERIIRNNSESMFRAIAGIIAYHPSGIKKTSMTKDEVFSWLEKNDFGNKNISTITENLKSFGIKMASKSPYAVGEKIRINNPDSTNREE